eukprot:7181762-Pyramimonas_sp.AAC.1
MSKRVKSEGVGLPTAGPPARRAVRHSTAPVTGLARRPGRATQPPEPKLCGPTTVVGGVTLSTSVAVQLRLLLHGRLRQVAELADCKRGAALLRSCWRSRALAGARARPNVRVRKPALNELASVPR